RDVRRLGTIRLLDENNWRLYNSRIGPEPLDPGFTIDEFVSRLSPSRQAIKKTMMDQKRIAGVGNIYANEALFRAGIHPRRQSNRLRPQQWDALYRETLAVLREAIASRGTTLRDYRTGKGDPGGFQFRLLAYGRGGQPCARCDTLMKTTHAIDGRASTYCWRCQGRR
ncbi:MAG: Fpg/Nei family DNA glycosylase, partial [Gemmatimonadales bacterium]